MRFTSRWRLTTSLTLTVAVLFVTVMGFTYLTYRDLTAEREAAEIENAVAISRTVAAQIDGFVQDVEGTTLAAALALGNEPGLSHQRTGPYLKAVRDNYTTLRALFLTDLQGRVIASASGEGIGLDLSQRPYMQRLRAGAPTTWSHGLKGIASGQTTVAFGRRVTDSVGHLRAFLVAAFYPPSLMARLRATLPDDAMVTLLDDEGNVLYSTHFPERSPVPDLGELPAVQQVLAGRPVQITGDAAPFSSASVFGAMVPVTRTRWAVVLTRPIEPLRAALRDPVLEQVIAISAVMLLALSLFVVISRWLIRPLEGLAKTAASIARGETPRIIQPSGPAEVAQLAEGMRVMVQAVDERERALQFINEASRQLASTLDYEATLRAIARLAVDRIADWCVVDVLEDDGRLRRLGVAHVDPAKIALASELEQRYPTDPNAPRGLYQVLRTGQSELYEDISDEMLAHAARDPEHLRMLRELGLRSAMIVPLIARGRTLGVMTFVTAESGRRYSTRDLDVAEALARRTAVAIDNARMYARERGIAETLQRSLLPER
ncbi:MAG: GAF domain-containing protein, partial [bacterium]